MTYTKHKKSFPKKNFSERSASKKGKKTTWEDNKKPARKDSKKPAWEDRKKPTWGDRKKPAWEDRKKPAWEDRKKPAWGDRKKPAWEDRKKPAWGDRKKPAWGDSKKPAWEDRKKPAWGDSKNTAWKDKRRSPPPTKSKRYAFKNPPGVAFNAPIKSKINLSNRSLANLKIFSAFSAKELANQEFIYGINPVRIALQANRRALSHLYLDEQGREQQDKHRQAIVDLAQKRQLPITYVDKGLLHEAVPDFSHQGVLLLAGFLPKLNLADLERAKEAKHLLAIDQVQDPQNLGALVRSACYFGFDGLVITTNRTSPINATVSKSSAGMLELFAVYQVVNLTVALNKMKDQGFWMLGTDVQGTNVYEFDPPEKFVLVLGNEHKGLGDNMIKQSDWVLTIPGNLRAESLNVSVAAGILMSVLLQKKKIF